MEGVGEAAAKANSDDRYTGAKISVWWDIENCKVPKDADLYKITRNIHSSLARMNYRGPVRFFCYGDTTLIPDEVQNALTITAMDLCHAPSDVRVEMMLVDMLFWAMSNPTPANILLISGDGRLSRAFHRLGNFRYNILLAAQPQNVSANLLGATDKVWLWTSLVADGPPLSDEEYKQLLLQSCENENEN